jgi:hypothetical protein
MGRNWPSNPLFSDKRGVYVQLPSQDGVKKRGAGRGRSKLKGADGKPSKKRGFAASSYDFASPNTLALPLPRIRNMIKENDRYRCRLLLHDPPTTSSSLSLVTSTTRLTHASHPPLPLLAVFSRSVLPHTLPGAPHRIPSRPLRPGDCAALAACMWALSRAPRHSRPHQADCLPRPSAIPAAHASSPPHPAGHPDACLPTQRA